MNSVLSRTTDAELEYYNEHMYVSHVEDAYATEPMVAIRPVFQRSDEEALHTSFEEAISDRVIALHGRLSRLSNPSLSTDQLHRTTGPVAYPTYTRRGVTQNMPTEQPVEEECPSLAGTARQRLLIVGFGLLCTLAGFDLMGLFMLHAR